MPARRPVPLLVIGGLVAAIVLGWGGYNAVSLMAYQSTYTDLSFPAASVHRLDVDTDGGVTIEAAPAGSSEVTITRRVVRGLRSPSYSEAVVGDTLTLRSSCPAFAEYHCFVSYSIHVPASTSVVVDTSGSSVHVHDLSGDLDVQSSGGSVEVARVSGALKLQSSGGGVRATDVSSKIVEADSSGGGVFVRFIAPPDDVKVSSSGGSAVVEVPHDETAYRTDVTSSGGSRQVDVKTDPDSTHVIEVDSSGGSARLRYPTG
jgi:hypothetical protein